MPTLKLVLCNVPHTSANSLAQQIVEEKLAACVNIFSNVSSVYRWEGEVETATEATLLIKTPDDRLPELKARLLELHPYDVPEVIDFTADSVNTSYMTWAIDVTRPE